MPTPHAEQRRALGLAMLLALAGGRVSGAAPGRAGLRLPDLFDSRRTLDLTALRGRPWLLHAWASWCAPCRRGHGALHEVASLTGLPLVGVAVRDDPRDAQEWLFAQGNPFTLQGVDREGREIARFGLAGLPGTLLMDATGVLAHRHDGALTREVWRREFAPRVAAAAQGRSSSASNSASGRGGANR